MAQLNEPLVSTATLQARHASWRSSLLGWSGDGKGT
jgi:hypothetical protein